MNKRQAKKAFKKKYGVNPNQACKAFTEQLPSAIKVITERLPDLVNEWVKAVSVLSETLRETLREMNSEEVKEFKEFMRQMSTQKEQDEGGE